MTVRRVVAVVPDLMDRSRLAAPDVDVTHVPLGRLAETVTGRDPVGLVVVDLSRPGALDAVAELDAPVVGFAPHVDDALLARAEAIGIAALPRSTFFRRWPDVGPDGPSPASLAHPF